jgi:hypothetical protein
LPQDHHHDFKHQSKHQFNNHNARPSLEAGINWRSALQMGLQPVPNEVGVLRLSGHLVGPSTIDLVSPLFLDLDLI